MNKIKFGKMEMYEDIPVLDLKVNEEIVGWLSPFRCYSFQVSGTKEGQNNLGSIRVVGLANCIVENVKFGPGYITICNTKEISMELLSAMASLALVEFANRQKLIVPKCKWHYSNYCPEEQEEYTKFINAVYDYVLKYKKIADNKYNK